jgi:hypothetical protein
MSIVPEHQATLLYGEEETYGQAPGSVNQDIGLIQRSELRINNKIAPYKGIGYGRNAYNLVAGGTLDTGINLTFQVLTGAFLEYVFGSVSGAGTSGDPFIYAEADIPASLTIEDGSDLSTDEVLRFLGCRCKRASIMLRLNEPVTATLEFDAKTLSRSNTLQTVTVPTTAVYEFVHGSVELPSGATMSGIQEAEIIIENGTYKADETGSRTSNVQISDRNYSIRVRKWLEDGTSIVDAMGGSASPSTGTPADAGATWRLNLTDGSRYIYVTLNNVKVDSLTLPKELGRGVEETVNYKALSGGATEVV